MSANDLWEGGEDLSPRKHWGSWGRGNKSSGTAFPPSTQDPQGGNTHLGSLSFWSLDLAELGTGPPLVLRSPSRGPLPLDG